ncbi:MAG TPA: LEA type 2 family protein [Thermoanaerobaculia bacterium]|jgi:LEA14-like dessication related protein
MKKTLSLGGLLAAICLAATLALLLSGCAALGRALNIENPRYSIRDIRPRVDIALPLSASSIDIDFALEVDNPNSVGLSLSQLDFNLLINDTRVLDSVSRDQFRIPANGVGQVNLQTRIGYQNIRTLWNEVVDIVRGQRARYELRGTAHYDTPVGRLQFPVTVYSTR